MASSYERRGGFAPIEFRAARECAIVMQPRRPRGGHVPGEKADALWRIALAIAREIEGNTRAGEDWMQHEAIAEFGGLTATDLIEVGQGEQVVGFLMDVLVGSRG